MCNSNSGSGGDGTSGTMVEADRLWRNSEERKGAAGQHGSHDSVTSSSSSDASDSDASSSRSDASRYYSCDDDGDGDDHLLAQGAFDCDDDEFEELTSAVVDVDALMERRAAGRRHSDPGNNRSSSSPGRLPPSSSTIEELPWHQPMPPRLPLRSYGGALTSIDEVPHLEEGATFAPAHRRTASLAVPSSTCGKDEDVKVEALKMDGGGDCGEDLIVDFPHNMQHEDTGGSNQSNSDSIKEEVGSHVDPKGRCVHHPHVQLVQHHPFGTSAKVLLSACPDCCMEELHRLHSSINSVEMDELRRLHLSSISEESDSEEDENYDDEESVDTRTTLASSRSTIHEPEEQSQGSNDGGRPNKGRSRRRRPTEETLRSESDSPPPTAKPGQPSKRRQFKSRTKPKTLAAGAARLLRRCGRRGDA